MDVYDVYYRYKLPDDKAPGIGAVKVFRLYARSLQEAKEMADQQSNYPHMNVIKVKKLIRSR